MFKKLKKEPGLEWRRELLSLRALGLHDLGSSH